VVDDEPSMRRLVTKVLEELGYQWMEAAYAEASLRILRSDVRIDLLITNVGLQDSLNGRQLADAAWQFRPELRVLFITGLAENAIMAHGRLGHDMLVLMKPFTIEGLVSRVRAMISAD